MIFYLPFLLFSSNHREFSSSKGNNENIPPPPVTINLKNLKDLTQLISPTGQISLSKNTGMSTGLDLRHNQTEIDVSLLNTLDEYFQKKNVLDFLLNKEVSKLDKVVLLQNYYDRFKDASDMTTSLESGNLFHDWECDDFH
jgi:hypothetical protein